MTPERRAFLLRAAPPLLVGGVIALLPVPEGLEFWILGFVVGAVFLGTYLLIGVPWPVWRSF